MTDFTGRDLTGARFEHVDLVDARFHMVDLSRAQFTAIAFHGVTMKGVELIDTTIWGDVDRLVINGVDVGPLIDAELNRRHPERAVLLEGTAEAYRRGWADLEERWADAVARARALPDDGEHRSVNGEWSFVQTLRHLSYATAAWVERMLLGRPDPFTEWDLPWDEAPAEVAVSRDRRDARMPLEDAVALWERRQAMVREYLAALTDDDLAGTVSCTAPGYPQREDFPVREGVRIAVMETWEHLQFADRDLQVLEAEGR